MKSTVHSTFLHPGANLHEWHLVDAVVGELGSTLDLPTLAMQTHQLLSQRLGLGEVMLCLLDASAQRLESWGPRPAHFSGVDPSWRMSAELSVLLRAPDVLLRVPAGVLPAGVASRAEALAFRLFDGGDPVGLVFLCDPEPTREFDASALEQLRSIGALIGSMLSRARTHHTLVNVTARLEVAQRLQQHILDHVSHEFNTPLMILKSAMEFADTDDREERAAFLDMHGQALKRLEELVQGVLEVARAHTHGRVERMSWGELQAAVIEPAIASRPWCPDQLMRWLDLPTDFPLRLDPDGLALVLDHLVRNAWQFGGEQGAKFAIAIYATKSRPGRQPDEDEAFERVLRGMAKGTAPACFTSEAGSDRLVIEIIDSGIGIPDDELEFVFEPFTQARNSPLRGVKGAGMGLPTCRKRVESMGGELWLYSRVGVGTRVTVRLPL